MRKMEELDEMDASTFAQWAHQHLAINEPEFRRIVSVTRRPLWMICQSVLKGCLSSRNHPGRSGAARQDGTACPTPAPFGRRRGVDADGIDGGYAAAGSLVINRVPISVKWKAFAAVSCRSKSDQ